MGIGVSEKVCVRKVNNFMPEFVRTRRISGCLLYFVGVAIASIIVDSLMRRRQPADFLTFFTATLPPEIFWSALGATLLGVVLIVIAGILIPRWPLLNNVSYYKWRNLPRWFLWGAIVGALYPLREPLDASYTGSYIVEYLVGFAAFLFSYYIAFRLIPPHK